MTYGVEKVGNGYRVYREVDRPSPGSKGRPVTPPYIKRRDARADAERRNARCAS